MRESMDATARLGREVARELDALPSTDADLARARARFLATAAGGERARPRRRAWAAGVVLAAAALVVTLLWRRDPPLGFRVQPGDAPGEVGAWIAAGSEQRLVRFSDGTAFSLAAGSRARVVSVDSRGARIAIERGRAHFEVRARDRARWQIDAGPFAVRVTGTAFDVAWDLDHERFELRLDEGSVVLTGPLVTEGRTVKAGQVARASLGPGRIEIVETPRLAGAEEPPPAASSPGARPGTPAPPPTAPGEAAGGASPVGRDAVGTASPRPRASWRALAAAGEYRQALAAARAAGFDGLCRSLPAADLARLADAARLAGDEGRAAKAYQAVRDRFPDDSHAALAAFALGRMDFDQRRAYGSAAQWFAVYLREQPDGALAREAAGRRLEALQRARDRAEARAAAAAYLRLYPDGPHATLARELARGQ